jgi:hypothetical protein
MLNAYSAGRLPAGRDRLAAYLPKRELLRSFFQFLWVHFRNQQSALVNQQLVESDAFVRIPRTGVG